MVYLPVLLGSASNIIFCLTWNTKFMRILVFIKIIYNLRCSVFVFFSPHLKTVLGLSSVGVCLVRGYFLWLICGDLKMRPAVLLQCLVKCCWALQGPYIDRKLVQSHATLKYWLITLFKVNIILSKIKCSFVAIELIPRRKMSLWFVKTLSFQGGMHRGLSHKFLRFCSLDLPSLFYTEVRKCIE